MLFHVIHQKLEFKIIQAGDWIGLPSYIMLYQSMSYLFLRMFSVEHIGSKISLSEANRFGGSLRNRPMQSQRNFSAAKKTLAGLGY